MILVSNYLLQTTPVVFPEDIVVVRINVAWIKEYNELVTLLQSLRHDIYLDYPQGRNKPPKPVLSIDQAIDLVHKFPKIRYFAVSNVEDPDKINAIKERLPAGVEVVPKIETLVGVNNMTEIVQKLGNKYVMLDKEDLYIDVNRDGDKFNELVELARKKAVESGIDLLELHGVVFGPYKKPDTSA